MQFAPYSPRTCDVDVEVVKQSGRVCNKRAGRYLDDNAGLPYDKPALLPVVEVACPDVSSELPKMKNALTVHKDHADRKRKVLPVRMRKAVNTLDLHGRASGVEAEVVKQTILRVYSVALSNRLAA